MCRRTLHSVRRSVRAWPVKYTATAGFSPSAGETPVPPPVTASRFGARDDDASSRSDGESGLADLSLPRETATSTASAHARAHRRRARLRGLAFDAPTPFAPREPRIASPPGARHRAAV